MKYLKKFGVKYRWVGMLGATLWWTCVYAGQAWEYVKHIT